MSNAAASPYRYAIGGMIGMAAGMGIGRFIYTPLLPAMMEELGQSASDAGLIASANFLGYLVGALLASGGWAHGRERALMLAAVGATAVLLALMAATASLAAFITIRFLAGVASAFMMVFLSTIVFGHLALANRNDLQALHFGGVGVGIAVSSIASGAMVVWQAPWQAGWISAAVLGAIGFAAVLLLVREGPLGAVDAPREPALPKSPALRRMILSYGLFGFGYVVTATFLVAIVRAGEGGRLFESVVWLVTGVSIIASTWVWNRVAARKGLARAYAAGMVVEAAGVVASVAIGGYAGPLIAAVLLGGTFVAVTAIGLQIGRRLADASPRKALALMTAAFGVGQIVGPVVAGALADLTGAYVIPSLLASAVLLASALLAWDAGRRSGIR
ncbi:MAG: MFS transporter [Mesorhizobium sp.]|nr:MFS transporter [Mesorhizobium sp.]